MNRSNNRKKYALGLLFLAGIVISFVTDYQPGIAIGFNFIDFFIAMLKVLPCTFILIGLFEVWVKKERIERHLGQDSGPLAFFWVILLAGTTVGGPLVAFPVAHSLYRKGAKLTVMFTYIGASAVCRIPMTIFESSFLGVRFTLIRFVVSLPLVIISSIWLGRFLEKRQYHPVSLEDDSAYHLLAKKT